MIEAIDPILTFRKHAFRVESLPDYPVNHAPSASFAYFLETGSVPPGHNEGWADIVKSHTAAGRRVERLRLVSRPLSDYERYELAAGYRPALAAGEVIRVAFGDQHDPVKDFWLYDDETLEWMNYDPQGEFQGSDVVSVTPADASLIQHWRDAFRRAEGISTFRENMGL